MDEVTSALSDLAEVLVAEEDPGRALQRSVEMLVRALPGADLASVSVFRRDAAETVASSSERVWRSIPISTPRVRGRAWSRMAVLVTSIRTTAGQLASTGDRVAATLARRAELYPQDAGRPSELSAAAHEFAVRSRHHATATR